MTTKRRTFSAEFKREAASLVLDQSHSYPQACESLGVGETALRRWVNQLSAERNNYQRPYSYNRGLAPAIAEEKPYLMSKTS